MPVLRSLLALVFLAVCATLCALIVFPWSLLSGSAAPTFAAGRWLGTTAVRLAGIRIKIIGAERLQPDQTYIFMSNHASNLDPPILLQAVGRRTSLLTKKSLFRLPVLGRAMTIVSFVPVDRASRGDALSTLRRASEVLRSGISLSIFVEGTRSPDGRLLPFKEGPFLIAKKTGLPIVPVTLLGTYDCLPKGRFAVNSGPVTVVFHEAIEPGAYKHREDLVTAVRESIASSLPPELR